MKIRAKFMVTDITQSHWEKYGREVVLEPRYDEAIPEDRRFSQATPTGQLRMRVNNPAALAELQLGRTFYLDLVPVDEPEAA